MTHPVPVPDRPLMLSVDGNTTIVCRPKRFSSGSCGWYASEKLDIDGTRVQVSLSFVVVGSKPPVTTTPDATKEGEEAAAPPKMGRKAREAKNGSQVVQSELKG